MLGRSKRARESQPKLPVKKKVLRLCYNEQSVRDQQKSTRGFTSLKHTESLYLLTGKEIDLPMRKRKHHTGTNQGETIENIVKPTTTP